MISQSATIIKNIIIKKELHYFIRILNLSDQEVSVIKVKELKHDLRYSRKRKSIPGIK